MHQLFRKKHPAPKEAVIGMDLEGVIAKSQERVIEIFNASSGAAPVQNAMLRNYDMTGYLRYGNGECITRQRLLELFVQAWEGPSRIKLVDDAIPRIFDSLDSWKILIATATVGSPTNVLEFLRMNKIAPARTTFFKTEEGKLDSIVGNRAMRAYVDDNPVIALEVAKAGKLSFCLDIYSRNTGAHKNLITIANWSELQKRLLEL